MDSNLVKFLQYPLGGLALAALMLGIFSLRTKRRPVSVWTGWAFLVFSVVLGVSSLFGGVLPTSAKQNSPPISTQGNANQIVVGSHNNVNSGVQILVRKDTDNDQ